MTKREIIDQHGFISIGPGDPLTFVMSREVLTFVDRIGEAFGMVRSQVLMATIVGEKIDPVASIFVRVGPARPADPRRPLTFDGKAGSKLALTVTQDRRAKPQGKIVTVICRLSFEKGN